MMASANYAKRPAEGAVILDGEWEAPVKVKAAQAALFNYAAVLQALWPADYTAVVIGQVLVKEDWGGQTRSDSTKATAIECFFNRLMVENAARAVKRKAPVDFRRAREVWSEVTEAWGPPPGGQQLQAVSGAGHSGNKSGKATGGSGGGGEKKGEVRGGARVGGRYICHRFNEEGGCNRDRDQMGCKGKFGQLYAHCCNFVRKDGSSCAEKHARWKAHK
jgi:uncharacterized membrane protein YgcG